MKPEVQSASAEASIVVYMSRNDWSLRTCAFTLATTAISLCLLFCVPMPCVAARRPADGSLVPINLRVSGLEAPLGLDDRQPYFGWQLQTTSPAHNVAQSAYRILVASNPGLLVQDRAELWDSGRIAGGDYFHVPYSGPDLHSHTTYWWKVCVWRSSNDLPTCSASSHWTTALLHPQDWTAKWIAAQSDGSLEPPAREGVGSLDAISQRMPLFRDSFPLDKPVKQALVFISGLGQYELHVNGRSVTDAVMTPGWTNYRKEVLYNTYDVTDRLAQGSNTLGVMLGNGMYNVPGIEGRYTKFVGSFGHPKMILQMQITFADGTEQVIASDQTWQTAPGPIVLSSIYGGEDYDARDEVSGWDLTSGAQWNHAVEVAAPNGSEESGQTLTSLLIPPMKVMEVIKPVKQSQLRPGTQIFDLGRNFSGWPELQVKGHAGDIVRLLPGELLDDTGAVTQRSASASKRNPVLFTYTLRGDGIETWHPRFSYYGFRYVQVESIPAKVGAPLPAVLSLAGDFVHDDASVDGMFQAESPMLNAIHHLIDQAILSNLASILTDCPTREKLGWLEQTHLNGGSVMYNYGVSQIYRKMSDDMSQAQLTNGMIPAIAPEYVAFVDKNGDSTAFRDSPEWGSAVILSPWAAYQFYGVPEQLAKHYASMTRYAAYLKGKSVDGLLTFGLGDWYDVGPASPGESQLTSKGLTATAIYYQDLVTLARIASLLQKPEDATRFAAEASALKAAFNRVLYHPGTRTYDRSSQTANAMPLYLGLVPEEDRSAVLENLVEDIRAHHNHVTAGDVGFHYVVGALSMYGRSDVLFDMVTRTDSPSYGYQLARGATTLTEAWDTNQSASQDHFMLGHAEEWFYNRLAGIDFDMSRSGADRILLVPGLDSGAQGASATLQTILGTIQSSWHRDGSHWSATFVVPTGAQATVVLPESATAAKLLRSGKKIEGTQTPGVMPRVQHWVLGSGTYRFNGTLKT